MSNKLTKDNKREIASLSDSKLNELLNPLSKEIHLFDTYIAGTMNIKDISILKNIKVNEKLNLIRKESIYGTNTIDIYKENDIKIGYIPEKDSEVFARLMDAGKCLIAKVSKIDTKGSFISIGIGIYLIDY